MTEFVSTCREGLHGEVVFVDFGLPGERQTSLALVCRVSSTVGRPVAMQVVLSGYPKLLIPPTPFAEEHVFRDVRSPLDGVNGAHSATFHVRVGTLDLPEQLEFSLVARIEGPDGRRRGEPIGEVRSVPAPVLRLAYVPRARPLLVPSSGRSGTTLLMGYIRAHPSILVPGKYPYEFRQASYLWHAARTLAAPASFDGSMHPDSFENSHPTSIGFNPYAYWQFETEYGLGQTSRWQDGSLPSSVIDAAKGWVDDFVRACALDQNKAADVAWIAEKLNPTPLVDFVKRIYPESREIVLVRDMRDAFVSARAFNRKRGTLSFGAEHATDDVEWLRTFEGIARSLVSRTREGCQRTVVLRYEDLVTEPRATLTTLLQRLDIPTDGDGLDAMLSATEDTHDAFGIHGSSASPAASIGRWREEMTPNERAIAAEIFDEYDRAFGYDA